MAHLTEQCTEDGCDRPVFTRKSGLCQRHYDRARTARLAAARPSLPLVRDTPCRVCGAAGYRRLEDGVLCQSCWDRLRRRGTVEPAERGNREIARCSVSGCGAIVHSRGLCQPHYRRALRHGDPTAAGVIGRPRSGSTDHRALPLEVKAQRLEARRAGRAQCAKGHELSGDNLLIERNGARSCRTCRDEQQRAYRRKTADERTHCRAGHPLTETNVYVRRNGVRQCRTCVRAQHLYTRFGVTLERYEQLLDEQDGRCCGCGVEAERNLAVDHDRACCATDQSCGKCVRGLLCTNCNMALGLLRDDPEALRRLAAYIESHR